jgi:hypothetical protein
LNYFSVGKLILADFVLKENPEFTSQKNKDLLIFIFRMKINVKFNLQACELTHKSFFVIILYSRSA